MNHRFAAGRLFSLLLLLLFLLGNFTPAAKAQEAVCLSDLDDQLSSFIEGNLAGSLTTVSSAAFANLYYAESGGKTTQNAETALRFTAYTFRKSTADSNAAETCYSVADIQFLANRKITKNDTALLTVNDYLLPVSPMSGVLYGKNRPEDSWIYVKELTALPASLNEISIPGTEMTSQYRYSRVLLTFSSEKNTATTQNQPGYQLDFTHDTTTAPILLILSILCSIAVLGALLWGHRRRQKNKAT